MILFVIIIFIWAYHQTSEKKFQHPATTIPSETHKGSWGPVPKIKLAAVPQIGSRILLQVSLFEFHPFHFYPAFPFYFMFSRARPISLSSAVLMLNSSLCYVSFLLPYISKASLSANLIPFFLWTAPELGHLSLSRHQHPVHYTPTLPSPLQACNEPPQHSACFSPRLFSFFSSTHQPESYN